MSNIKPFQAVHYNPAKVKDFAKVVCPPYDVISVEEQDALGALSPYNFIHVMLGKDLPGDDKNNNKYSRAKRIYDEWLKEGVLQQDEKPSIYFYKQEYKVLGEKHSRLGFISLMELDEESESRVVPHENTHAAAVDDRLRLWKKLNSNLSCIFVCYSDRQKKIDQIFNKNISASQPMVDVRDKDQVRHVIWRLSDPALIKEINGTIGKQHLFIADGHHRYKVAQELRRQKAEKEGTSLKGSPFNYVMTYFTNMDSKDLQIFPMHRILRHLPKDLDFLEEFFRVDKVKAREELPILLGRAGQNEHAFGLYTRDGIRLLRLKNKLLINENVPEGSREYKSLDATILKYFVFDRVGVDSKDIVYTKDLGQIFGMVDNGKAEAGFAMNPVQISQLRAIALNGEKMPPKTTYFYPKVLSGLTIYKMD